MAADKYLFWRALRPFSFSVAVVVCLTGILFAHAEGQISLFLSVLILVAGLLLQAGVNLINDYSDLALLNSAPEHKSRQHIQQNFRLGLGCLFVAALIGLFLIYQSGWVLLLYAVIGVLGALGYTLEPVNYKRRGLAVFLVFWLMGVLMVTGGYYALTQHLTAGAFFISIPVSLYTSLLLLSNEIRDYESDAAAGIGTLSVRIGYFRAVQLYYLLLAGAFISAILIAYLQIISHAWLVVLSLPVAVRPLTYLDKGATARTPVTPATGHAFFLFGALYCIAIVVSA